MVNDKVTEGGSSRLPGHLPGNRKVPGSMPGQGLLPATVVSSGKKLYSH